MMLILVGIHRIFGRRQSNEIEWDLLSEIVAPKPVRGSEWIYLQRQFFIYENQGCDKCIRNVKPPYLPPLRGVHVSYDAKTSDYLCGFCVRSQLVPFFASKRKDRQRFRGRIWTIWMTRFARYAFGRFLPMLCNQNIIWFQSWKAEKRVRRFFCTIFVTKKYMQAWPKPNWQEIIIQLTRCGSIQELPNLSIGLKNGQPISIRAFQTNAGKICRKGQK